jgi:hypothetical protein
MLPAALILLLEKFVIAAAMPIDRALSVCWRSIPVRR